MGRACEQEGGTLCLFFKSHIGNRLCHRKVVPDVSNFGRRQQREGSDPSLRSGLKENTQRPDKSYAFFPAFFSGMTNAFASIPFSRAACTAFNALSGCSSCLK